MFFGVWFISTARESTIRRSGLGSTIAAMNNEAMMSAGSRLVNRMIRTAMITATEPSKSESTRR